ncbi:TlpA disulfide reductase family protein [Sphingobacterium sp.]|uniref:TlpA family protein disulfide reductase n=1 Tax=Sphingobacterium sp. TaxID=341027 RepID=UPI0025842610|nr:TlpA disulfide reductase family protein [Sphingobacterium sp.]WET68774.1 MAG: TlpA disulfide reductase family protein [Sphingobacterium sp.]
MKNFNIYTVIFLLLSSVSITRGQVKFVVPQVETTQVSDSIILYTAHDYLIRNIEDASNKKVWKLSKGNRLSLDIGQEYSYLVIHNEELTGRNRPLLIKNDLIINLEIDKAGKITFSKKQSKLVECQLKLAQLGKYPRSKQIKPTKEHVDNLIKARSDNRYLMDSIINSYATCLSEDEREILRNNCMASIDLALFSILGRMNSDATTMAYVYDQYKQISLNSKRIFTVQHTIETALLGEYGFRLQFNELNLERTIHGHNFTYSAIYDQINKHNRGIARDRAIAESILNEIQYDRFPLSYLDSALMIVKDSVSRAVIMAQKESRTTGKILFPFVFEDVQKREITPSDLEGKVLIIDFWYNGCLGCAKLAKVMEDVIDAFHERDVVFLSVNVDKNRARWIEGVKSGIYTSPYNLNVYTKGQGQNHPFLLHYKYRSFPQLMIVDRSGKLVTANATRPFDAERRKELVATIENLLK